MELIKATFATIYSLVFQSPCLRKTAQKRQTLPISREHSLFIARVGTEEKQFETIKKCDPTLQTLNFSSTQRSLDA